MGYNPLMFSGIVESVQPVLHVRSRDLNSVNPSSLQIEIAKPENFQDLKIGDSIAVNGVCLTLEQQTEASMSFTLGYETLRLLRMTAKQLKNSHVNLERSLRFGDRIHGHLVTGHVEGLAQVLKSEAEGDCWLLDLELPAIVLKNIWDKGSLTVHGISLTVNSVEGLKVRICLIPETIKRTNLASFQVGDFVHVESDYFAKLMQNYVRVQKQGAELEG